MPPFTAPGLYLTPNATVNGSVPANATCPENALGQEVSWQSAYWPVVACMVAVLLQETGRVMNGPFSWSYALRASHLSCVFDTSLMLLKFVVLLVIGCSPRTAARHVWYDRFDQEQDDLVTSNVMEIVGFFVKMVGYLPFMGDAIRRSVSVAVHTTIEPVSFADLHGEPAKYMKPPPGSTVDRGWRLSMMSFVFGALPQAIKVFAMKGVSSTQVLVAIYLVSFVLSEAFRSLAGPVGQFNLYPIPRVLNAKSFLCHRLFFLYFGFVVSMFTGVLFFSAFVVLTNLNPLVALVPFGMMLALPVTLLPLGVLQCLIALCPKGIRSYIYDFKMFQFLRTNLVACIAGSLALSPSPVERHIVFVCLYIPCFIGVVWSLSGASTFWIQGGDVMVLVVFLSSPFALLILYITHRLLFVGYLSNVTHRLCGTEGTTQEFLKGTFILINFVDITISYANTWNSSETFKPRWVEVLG